MKAILRAALLLVLSASLTQTVGAQVKKPCRVTSDESAVYAVLLAARSQPARDSVYVVDPRTQNGHFAKEPDIDWYLLQESAAIALPQLRNSPPGSTMVFTITEAELSDPSSSARKELLHDYTEKLKVSCLVGRIPNTGNQVRYSPLGELSSYFPPRGKRDGWKLFHAKYSDSAVLISLSRVAFDRSGKFAMVTVSSGIDWLAGGGELYLLERRGKQWVITHHFQTWTT